MSNQHRLLLIRDILKTMEERRDLTKPSDFLPITCSWVRVRNYVEYLNQAGIIRKVDAHKESPRVRRKGVHYYSITEEGYQLLQKIKELEKFCKLEKLLVDLHKLKNQE